jgi:hypothetical protein
VLGNLRSAGVGDGAEREPLITLDRHD